MSSNFKNKIRRKCPKIFIFFIFMYSFILISCLFPYVYADTVTLKTGGRVKGLITQEKDSEIVVKIGVGSTVIKKDQILKIDRDSKESIKVKEENASKLYKQAEEEYNKIKALKWDFSNLAKYDKVVEECDKIVQKFPESTESLKAQALIVECYDQQGKFKKKYQAQDAYINTVELHLGKDKAAEALKVMADKEFLIDENSNAQAFYDTLMEKYPGYISITEVADKYFKAKKYDLARRYYQKAIEQDLKGSNSPYAYFKIAGSYTREGDYKKSITEYNKLISQYPKSKWSEEGYYQMANCYLLLEKPEEAIVILKEMIKKYPEGALANDAKYLVEKLMKGL